MVKVKSLRKSTDCIDISLCFPIKNRSFVEHDGKVLKLFVNCLNSIGDSLKDSDINYEIVIADFMSSDCVLKDWVGTSLGALDYSIIDVDHSFSRGLGMNICAANSRGKYLSFLDADMIFYKKFFRLLEKEYSEDSIFFPVCFKANESNTEFNFKDGDWQSHGYGLSSLSKSRFIKMGFWPEFNSYGGEDNIFYDKCVKNYSKHVKRYSADGLLHQWHPPSRDLNYKNKKTTDYFNYIKDGNKGRYYPKDLNSYKVN
ncbi:MAG: glycosyltransferase family A protein [Promethearchaeota archaeon]|jgi:hypothetical protein